MSYRRVERFGRSYAEIDRDVVERDRTIDDKIDAKKNADFLQEDYPVQIVQLADDERLAIQTLDDKSKIRQAIIQCAESHGVNMDAREFRYHADSGVLEIQE